MEILCKAEGLTHESKAEGLTHNDCYLCDYKYVPYKAH